MSEVKETVLKQPSSRELRRILVNGRLDGAAELLEQLQGGETVEALSTWEALSWIVAGIQQVLNQDTPGGMEQLEKAAAVAGADESLRWVALHWITKAAASQGQLARAERAATECVELAESIGPQALSLSLLSLAELTAYAGRHEETLTHLKPAIAVLKEVHDDRGAATALLAMARTLHRLGHREDSLAAADNALQSDPTWPDAAVFLSERALEDGDVEQASRHIAPFLERSPCPPNVERQRALIDGIKSGRYDAVAVAELLLLRDEPLRDEVVEEMRNTRERFPEFYELRELIAWSLYKLGHKDEAEAEFKAMTSLALPPQLRASVTLGLACIASGRHHHPAARVRAASGSFPPVRTPPVKTVELKLPSDTSPAPPEPRSRLERDTAPLPVESAPAAVRRPGPTLAVNATFVGDLQLLAVPDLLDFLYSSRRTGTLIITSGLGTAAVHLINGRITGASAPDSPSLGHLLVQKETLTSEGLETALDQQKGNDSKLLLGSILVQQGLVDREVLEQALVEQVRTALLEAVAWHEGRFAFEPDGGTLERFEDQLVVDLDTRAILMDVMRQYDELSR